MKPQLLLAGGATVISIHGPDRRNGSVRVIGLFKMVSPDRYLALGAVVTLGLIVPLQSFAQGDTDQSNSYQSHLSLNHASNSPTFDALLIGLFLIAVAIYFFAPIDTPLDEDSVSAFGRLTPRDCLIGSNIDLRTMIAKMADLRDKHAIRSDVDAAHVRVRA